MASDYDSVVVLNEGYELRTSKTGKTRATIVVRSEPIVINTDPKALGAPVAAAIVHHFREKIAGIAAVAAPATLKARKVAAKAFAEGKSWAMKRYSGGKTGPMAPNQSDRAFNDSGRSVKTITANASSDGAWRVNFAANRLSAATSGGVQRIYDKLISFVPELANPALLLENDIVRKGIEKSMAAMITKQQASSSKLGLEIVRQVIDIGRQLAEIGDALAS